MRGKVFAVTGAGSGIGRATTLRLAELGAQGIAISDVNEAALEETKALCMHQVGPVQIYVRGLPC
jgi:NAD(P)-dependent dehydrogenase (short-subunit alcohol dehydrogenase family)